MLQGIGHIINTKIGIAVATCIVTVILNVFYNKWHIGKEQKTRYENVVGDKIAKALIAIRDIELGVKTQEIYQINKRIYEYSM